MNISTPSARLQRLSQRRAWPTSAALQLPERRLRRQAAAALTQGATGSFLNHKLVCARQSRGAKCLAAPWTKEELEKMMAEEQAQQEEQVGERWRSGFKDDLRGLYETRTRQKQEPVDAYKGIGSSVGPFQAMPPGVATDVIGMGSWRLRGEVEPAIEFLVGQLEGTWRELLGDELTLYPRDKWKSRGWDLIDSMDLGRELGGFAYADVPDPEPGADGYPRLLVENRLYCSRVFRKLHLEVAVRQDGLHVLHVVMYPRYEYDLPIFAMDVVASKGVVTLAIVDACPSRGDKSLPPQYLQTMAALQEEFLHPPGQAGSSSSGRQRAVPDWGAEIFSPLCVSIAPRTPDELSRFARYCLALHRAHLQLARLLTPVPESAPDRRASLHDGHQRFVANQLQNKKTTRVLEAAWYPDGKELAEQYMAQLLFDYSPQDAPPWHDASVGRLYSYFETAPEPSRDEKEAKAFVIKVNVEKASGYLADFMTGGRAVTTAKMEWALAYLFEHDDEYRSAVSAVLPGWQQHQAEGTLGAVLLEELQRQTGGAAGNKKPPMP